MELFTKYYDGKVKEFLPVCDINGHRVSMNVHGHVN